jgi:hypothetical protein
MCLSKKASTLVLLNTEGLTNSRIHLRIASGVLPIEETRLHPEIRTRICVYARSDRKCNADAG